MSCSIFTLTFAVPAASPFSALQFLETYEDEFLAVVDPKQGLLKLKHKGVISADVKTAIESANDEDAKFILFDHLQRHATVDTLRVYCDVAIAAIGFPRMQELGKKMMDALSPGGWLDLWLHNECMSECSSGACLIFLCVLNVCMCSCLCACMCKYYCLFLLCVVPAL